jgi:crotonobetainyl-CoA:carnitine CoA-transferase CaiB-like acyl-CoA transferase
MPEQALAGIRVIEFGAYAAGPAIGKHLADHGAEVIHVESHLRPDGFRTHYPPYKDHKVGLERSGLFALCNNNKQDVTLNLKHPRGVELARELVKRSQVVVENFTPGTMSRLGLGWEHLSALNPGLVMLSTCNQGQFGPHANHPGFGSHLSSLAGFTNLIGYEDSEPMLLYGPYIDFIAVGYGVLAVVAALDFRRRTGQGQYIDLSQLETGLQFQGRVVLDYASNGRVAQRQGNHHPHAAPHEAFPCKGDDEWVAISVHDDAQWQALVRALGSPDWACAERFATVLGRKAHEAEIYEHLAAWTRPRDKREVERILQQAGVPAVAVNNMADLFADPQLQYRGSWQYLDHPEIGHHAYETSPWILSETPSRITSPAPLLGQHNRTVYTGVLGLSEAEFERLQAEGVFE